VSKPKPEKVNPTLAREAVNRAKDRQSAWSEYVRLSFRRTGNLAPGCDAKDFYGWLKQND